MNQGDYRSKQKRQRTKRVNHSPRTESGDERAAAAVANATASRREVADATTGDKTRCENFGTLPVESENAEAAMVMANM